MFTLSEMCSPTVKRSLSTDTVNGLGLLVEDVALSLRVSMHTTNAMFKPGFYTPYAVRTQPKCANESTQIRG